MRVNICRAPALRHRVPAPLPETPLPEQTNQRERSQLTEAIIWSQLQSDDVKGGKSLW